MIASIFSACASRTQIRPENNKLEGNLPPYARYHSSSVSPSCESGYLVFMTETMTGKLVSGCMNYPKTQISTFDVYKWVTR